MVTGKTTNNITPFITNDMKKVHGAILTETGFKKGYVEIHEQNHAILHIKKESIEKESCLIIPSILNAHTHIGDTFIREKNITLPRDIEKLVAPPEGLKHKLLKTTNQEEIKNGMIRGLQELKHHGINTFVDFRENGVEGLRLIIDALQQEPVDAILLGRPETLTPTINEINDILNIADGIGLSSVTDWNPSLIQSISKRTKQQNKIFALHASERIQEPITTIIDLQPDLLVHMTVASKTDLFEVKQHEIPIVVCPRSNQFFGMKPNLENMHDVGNTILLGTDNFMLHQPSIMEEIKYIQEQFPGLYTLEELLLMNTYQGKKILSKLKKSSKPSFPTSWMILDASTLAITGFLDNVEQG